MLNAVHRGHSRVSGQVEVANDYVIGWSGSGCEAPAIRLNQADPWVVPDCVVCLLEERSQLEEVRVQLNTINLCLAVLRHRRERRPSRETNEESAFGVRFQRHGECAQRVLHDERAKSRIAQSVHVVHTQRPRLILVFVDRHRARRGVTVEEERMAGPVAQRVDLWCGVEGDHEHPEGYRPT